MTDERTCERHDRHTYRKHYDERMFTMFFFGNSWEADKWNCTATWSEENIQIIHQKKCKWFTLTEHNNNYSFCQKTHKKTKAKCLTYESRVQISNSVEMSKHLETVRQHDNLLHGELETIVFIWTKALSWHLHTLNCVSVILFALSKKIWLMINASGLQHMPTPVVSTIGVDTKLHQCPAYRLLT